MKDMMKGIGIALLAVAAVVAAQTALSFVVGFRTAELLFLFAVIRAGRKRR